MMFSAAPAAGRTRCGGTPRIAICDFSSCRGGGYRSAVERYQRGIGPVDGLRHRVDSRDMGIAVLGPLQVDGQVNGLSPRDRVVLSAMVVRAGRPDQHGGPGGRALGRAAPCVLVQGGPGLRRAAAQAARRRGDRVGDRRIPADPERRRAGPPAVRTAPGACTRGNGRRRPGPGGVPGPGGPRLCGAVRALPDVEEWEPGPGGGRPARGSADGG